MNFKLLMFGFNFFYSTIKFIIMFENFINIIILNKQLEKEKKKNKKKKKKKKKIKKKIK